MKILTTLYVKEQGSYVKKSGNRIIVTKDDKKLLDFPIFNVENLVIFGNIQISAQALHMIFENGIDVTYLSSRGRYIGHAKSDTSKNIFLRMAQYEKYRDKTFRLNFARSVVKNKVQNQINLLRKHNWGNEDTSWKDDITKMEGALKGLDSKDEVNAIMGIEGICSSIYFSRFALLISNDFEFNKRTRRPARDPVNALLNLGYAFLNNEMSAILESHSFETYLGFIHGIKYGRKSLPLDMIEQFRQPIIDRLTLNLINHKIINKDDFCEEEGGIILNETAFGVFCKQYEEYLTKRGTQNNESYRDIMKKQVINLKDSIMMEKDYKPFVMEI